MRKIKNRKEINIARKRKKKMSLDEGRTAPSGTLFNEYENNSNSNEAIDLTCLKLATISQQLKPTTSYEKKVAFPSSAKRLKTSQDQFIFIDNERRSPIKQSSVERKLSSIIYGRFLHQPEAARVAEAMEVINPEADTMKLTSSSTQNRNKKYAHFTNEVEETVQPFHNKVVEIKNLTCKGCELRTGLPAKLNSLPATSEESNNIPQFHISTLFPTTKQLETTSQVPLQHNASTLPQNTTQSSPLNTQHVYSNFPPFKTTTAQVETSTVIQASPQYISSSTNETATQLRALRDPQVTPKLNTSLFIPQSVCSHLSQCNASTTRLDTSKIPSVNAQFKTSIPDSLNVCPHRQQFNASTRRLETSTTSQAPPHFSSSTTDQSPTLTTSQCNTSLNDPQKVCSHRLQFNQISTSTISQNSATHQFPPTDDEAAVQTENTNITEALQPREAPIKQEKYNLMQPPKVSHSESHQDGCTSCTKVEQCNSQERYAFSTVPQARASCSSNTQFDTSTVPQMLIPRVACILTPQLQESTASHAILQSDNLTLGLQFQPTIFQTMFPQRQSYVIDSQLQNSSVSRPTELANEHLFVSRVRPQANFRPVLQVSPQTSEYAAGTAPHTPLTNPPVFGLQFQAPVVSQPPGYYFSLQLQSSNDKIDPSKTSEEEKDSKKTKPPGSTTNVSQNPEEDASRPGDSEERPLVVEEVQIAAEALSLLKTKARVNQSMEIGTNTDGLPLQLSRQALESTWSDQSILNEPKASPLSSVPQGHIPLESLHSNHHESAENKALQSKFVSNPISGQKSTKHKSKVQILDNITLKTSASVETIKSPSSLHMPDVSDIPLPLKSSNAHSRRTELLNSSPPQIKIASEELARMLRIPTRCQIPLDSIHLPSFAATGVKIDASYFKRRLKCDVPKKPKKFKLEKQVQNSKATSNKLRNKVTSKSRTPALSLSNATLDSAINSDQQYEPSTKPSKYSLLAAVTAFSALQRNKILSETAVKDFPQTKPFIISIPSPNTTRGVITPLVQSTRPGRQNASESSNMNESKTSSKARRDDLKPMKKKSVHSEKLTSKKSEKKPKRQVSIPEKTLKTPVDAFGLLINGEMIERIVKFTNGRISDPTDKAELKAFIGLLLISGGLKQNALTIQEIWSQCFGTGIHRAVLQESRFQALSETISFGDLNANNENRGIGSLWEEYLDNCKRYSLPLLHMSSNEKDSGGFSNGADDDAGHNYSTARRTVNMSLRILCSMLDGAASRGLAMFRRKNPSITMTVREYMKQVGMRLVRPHLRRRLQRKSLKTSIRDLIESVLREDIISERHTSSPALVEKVRYNLECQLCSYKESSSKRTKIQCYSCHRTMCKKHRTKLCTDCAKEL